MKKKTELTDESIKYLGQWAQDQLYDDYQAFYDCGLYELCAIILAGSGAIEENNNDEEKNINKVANEIDFEEEKKMINDFFKSEKPIVLSCKDCNHHAYFTQSAGFYEDLEELKQWHCSSCLKTNWQIEYIDGKEITNTIKKLKTVV